jgi:hypothetical protein
MNGAIAGSMGFPAVGVYSASKAKIIDRGRGPEIAGTRITIYDVRDDHKRG